MFSFRTSAFTLLLAASLVATVIGLTIEPGACKNNASALLSGACVNQPAGSSVCWPCSKGKYVVCGGNGGKDSLRSCAKGKLFSYPNRTCLTKTDKTLQTCHNLRCPVTTNFTGFEPITNLGNSVYMANMTLNYTVPVAKLNMSFYSPADGHCLNGQMLTIVSWGKAPKGHQKKSVKISWSESLSDVNPEYVHQPDLKLYAGDEVSMQWADSIMQIAQFNNKVAKLPAVVPYPPQMVYQCPVFGHSFRGTPRNETLLPNETLLSELVFDGNSTYTFVQNDTLQALYIADHMPKHCHWGMVFKVDVKPAPAGYKPVTTNFDWKVTWDLFPGK